MKKNDNISKMRQYLEIEKQKTELRKKKIKEIVLNNNYIEWLVDFSKKYPQFRDSDSVNNRNISERDLENIKDLYFLYECISQYASNNYIYPSIDSDFVEYYKIQYNNIGFEVGIMTGQGIICFYERVNDVTNEFIDFNDIILNKKQANTIYFDSKLNELHDKIIFCYNQGIPFQAIKKITDDSLWEIEDKDKQKVKTYRR